MSVQVGGDTGGASQYVHVGDRSYAIETSWIIMAVVFLVSLFFIGRR